MLVLPYNNLKCTKVHFTSIQEKKAGFAARKKTLNCHLIKVSVQLQYEKHRQIIHMLVL